MLHAIGVQLGIDDLEVNDSVDLHGDVVLGDDGLGREIDYLLLQADPLGHAVNKGQLDMDAHAPGGLVRAQALHHEGAGLLDDLNVRHQQDEDDDANGGKNIRHVDIPPIFR